MGAALRASVLKRGFERMSRTLDERARMCGIAGLLDLKRRFGPHELRGITSRMAPCRRSKTRGSRRARVSQFGISSEIGLIDGCP